MNANTLAALRGMKRLATEEPAPHIQREPAQAMRTLRLWLRLALRKPMARRVVVPIRLQLVFIRPQAEGGQGCLHSVNGF